MPNVLSYNFDVNWGISKWLHIAGGLGPVSGALITTFIFEGKSGINRFINEKYIKHFSLKWTLIGFGLPVLLFLCAFILFGIINGKWIDLSVLGFNSKLSYSNPFLVWLTWCFFYGFGEEGGWRGFLLPELAKGFSVRNAALLTALFWAPWHLPVFFYDKDFLTFSFPEIAGWVVGLTFGSVLLAFIVQKSKWNLIPVILWHGTYNFFTTSEKLDDFLPMVMTMILMVIVVFITVYYGRDLERKNSL